MSKGERCYRVTIVMSKTLKEKVQALAKDNERSMSDFIRLVIKEYVEALEGQMQIEVTGEI